MDSKKIKASISRFAAWVGLKVCSLIMKVTPPRGVYAFARVLGTCGFRLIGRQRRIALNSLAIAFGKEKTGAEIERIARDCFILMAKSGFELLFLMDKPELVEKKVQIVGKDYLDKSLMRGKGVILVSAHFGNFPLLLARLALAGYKAGGIMRPMRDTRAEKIFMDARNRFNIRTIYSQPRNVCVKNTIQALRDNELLFIPLDQNFGSGGIFVDFFGTKAATATGPVILAQRTGAAMLPCFIVRQPDDSHQIIFEPPIDVSKDSRDGSTLQATVQKLTGIIEFYIRRYPAEWGWVHKRWKSRPKEN
jgi:Kdo2-lipid IVA lauroyltransferase/acyltransferase